MLSCVVLCVMKVVMLNVWMWISEMVGLLVVNCSVCEFLLENVVFGCILVCVSRGRVLVRMCFLGMVMMM